MKLKKNRSLSIQIYQDLSNWINMMCKIYRKKKEKDKDETVLRYLSEWKKKDFKIIQQKNLFTIVSMMIIIKWLKNKSLTSF
jgi:hypothetical protein